MLIPRRNFSLTAAALDATMRPRVIVSLKPHMLRNRGVAVSTPRSTRAGARAFKAEDTSGLLFFSESIAHLVSSAHDDAGLGGGFGSDRGDAGGSLEKYGASGDGACGDGGGGKGRHVLQSRTWVKGADMSAGGRGRNRITLGSKDSRERVAFFSGFRVPRRPIGKQYERRSAAR